MEPLTEALNLLRRRAELEEALRGRLIFRAQTCGSGRPGSLGTWEASVRECRKTEPLLIAE